MEGKEGRTERATPKRRNEQRNKGNLCLSNEITTVAVLFFGLLGLRFGIPFIGQQLDDLLHVVLNQQVGPDAVWTGVKITSWFKTGALFCGVLMLPVVAPVVVATVLSTVAQTGLFFSMEALNLKFGALNPVNGAKQLFSTQSLYNIGTALLKILLIVLIMWVVLHNRILQFTSLMWASPAMIFAWTMKTIFLLAMTVVVLYSSVAALDYVYRWYTFEKSIMMTKKEVEDERKNQELPSILKGAQRRRMRELSVQRMMTAVAQATVVITNPTHVAVALEYSPEKMTSPKVVAKGLRLVAQRIKRIAKENGVPIIERPEVARDLYKHVKIGREIPSRFFGVVAEIMAYLYRLGQGSLRSRLAKQLKPQK